MLTAGGECLYLPQTNCAWTVCVGGVCVCLLANFRLDESASRMPRIRQGYQVDRRVAIMLGECVNLFVFVNLGSVLCVLH